MGFRRRRMLFILVGLMIVGGMVFGRHDRGGRGVHGWSRGAAAAPWQGPPMISPNQAPADSGYTRGYQDGFMAAQGGHQSGPPFFIKALGVVALAGLAFRVFGRGGPPWGRWAHSDRDRPSSGDPTAQF